MNIDNLTLGQLKEIMSFSGASKKEYPLNIGDKVFIRTVTHIQTGQVCGVCGQFVRLDQAAWIADTGRFNEAMKSGEYNEVEPFHKVKPWVNLDASIDFGLIENLTTEVKG